MKKIFLLALVCAGCAAIHAQESNLEAKVTNLVENLSIDTMQYPTTDTMLIEAGADNKLDKKHFFYGYNFDIYYHHDTRNSQKNNGWSISVQPEFGYKINPRTQVGLRLGGSYASTRIDYPITTEDNKDEIRQLRISSGSWEVTPFGRYRLKTLFNGKVGIWLEAHLYTGMEFPRVTSGDTKGTDYDGLRHSITYGAQLSPVITYQFSEKSTFQVFFSILSFGYSGTTFCYQDENGGRYREYSNDVIIFSGKLRNLLSNQFTPGLYGLKFGVQKSF